MLADALHEAKDKLLKIKLAESSNISTDELIRYSYIISRAESISAPIDWMAGDQRRPFPTEIQMTQGLLHASNNETMLANLNQGQGNNANNKNNKNNQNSKNLLDGKLRIFSNIPRSLF